MMEYWNKGGKSGKNILAVLLLVPHPSNLPNAERSGAGFD
jgi:hypothetical protein